MLARTRLDRVFGGVSSPEHTPFPQLSNKDEEMRIENDDDYDVLPDGSIKSDYNGNPWCLNNYPGCSCMVAWVPEHGPTGCLFDVRQREAARKAERKNQIAWYKPEAIAKRQANRKGKSKVNRKKPSE